MRDFHVIVDTFGNIYAEEFMCLKVGELSRKLEASCLTLVGVAGVCIWSHGTEFKMEGSREHNAIRCCQFCTPLGQSLTSLQLIGWSPFKSFNFQKFKVLVALRMSHIL